VGHPPPILRVFCEGWDRTDPKQARGLEFQFHAEGTFRYQKCGVFHFIMFSCYIGKRGYRTVLLSHPCAIIPAQGWGTQRVLRKQGWATRPLGWSSASRVDP